MRLVLAMLACAAAALAQNSQMVFENDKVRVVKAVLQPRHRSAFHERTVNRVLVYLESGREEITYKDGGKRVIDWRAGEARWIPAAGAYTAELTSETPVTIIEVELKKSANSGKRAGSALSPLLVDPKHYRLEMENDQVRITRVKIGPRESTPLHEHALDRAVVYLTEQNFRITPENAAPEHVVHKSGDVGWGSAVKHVEENLAAQPFEVVVVELKD